MDVVKDPSPLEKRLFAAGLVQRVPLEVIYDLKAHTSIQRAWQTLEGCTGQPDIHDPAQWDHKLQASMRGEFFVHALRACGRVLDMGCGEGWPALYLAREGMEVVGVDLSSKHIALARHTANLMGLANARFEVAHIEALPFPDNSFDGVCFGGNVFTYSFDARAMLSEIQRVLRPGGPFAFEQWPVNPVRPPWERIQWFIDGGPPILHYGAGSGLYNRSYFIVFKPDSAPSRILRDLAKRMAGELSPEQQAACEALKAELERGPLNTVERVLCSGEDRSMAANEFPALLQEAGFNEVRSWALPDAVAFARSLAESGLLAHLRSDDLRAYLRALVAAAPTVPGWAHPWVTCKRSAV